MSVAISTYETLKTKPRLLRKCSQWMPTSILKFSVAIHQCKG